MDKTTYCVLQFNCLISEFYQGVSVMLTAVRVNMSQPDQGTTSLLYWDMIQKHLRQRILFVFIKKVRVKQLNVLLKHPNFPFFLNCTHC